MQRAASLPPGPSRPYSLAGVASERLLVLVAEERIDALAELYDRFRGLAYKLALRVLRDPHLAEDAVQDAFVALWRTAPAFEAERGSARTWILTLTHRRAVDRVRREQRQATGCRQAAPPEQMSVGPDSIERLRVRAALSRLAPAERRVVELSYYDGLTQADIAYTLQVPIGTVKSRSARALAHLATLLNDGSDTVLCDARDNVRG